MTETRQDLEDKARRLQEEHETLQKKTMDLQAAAADRLQGQFGGFNRLSMTSDRYHALYPELAREFLDLTTGSTQNIFVYKNFELDHEEPTYERLSQILTEFEKCLIALIFLEAGHSEAMIAVHFGVDEAIVMRCLDVWVPEWGKVGEHLSILPFIDAEFLDATEPQPYIDQNLRKVGAIVDSTDFYAERVGDDMVASTIPTRGGKPAFRVLIWSTPSGLVFERTKPVLANSCSERALNDFWSKLDGRLHIPPGYAVILTSKV